MPEETRTEKSKTRREAPFAILGYFDTPAEIYHACEHLRDAGYQHFDAHTPFPVHGLEKAMGLKPSRLPFVVLTMGVLGFLSAIAMMYYTSVVDYPLNISGKDAFSYQAYVPITFELTVLFSAFGTFFGMWIMNKLPMHYHPLFKHPTFYRATSDKFFISIEAREPKFDTVKTKALLEKLGAKDVAEVSS